MREKEKKKKEEGSWKPQGVFLTISSQHRPTASHANTLMFNVQIINHQWFNSCLTNITGSAQNFPFRVYK